MAATPKAAENLPAMQAGGRVAAIIPTNFNEVVQIAGAIVRAGMAPRGYEGSTEKATVAIMAGMEVGLTPFAALQSIAVINGTPAIFGDGLVALVRASGLLEDMEEGLQVAKDGTPEIAWCKVKRKGEKTWKERSLTMAECHRAGWAKKQGPWTLTPGRMMTIRVRGWLYRDVFADVLKGLKSAEEMQDMVDITPKPAAPPEPQRSDYTEQPSPPADAPPSGTGKDGQPTTSPPAGAGGDSKPEAASKPAPTDVEDLNEQETDDPDLWPERPKEGEKLEFVRFSKTSKFAEFAEAFLPRTNKMGAAQFAEFYDGTLIAMEKGSANAQAAAAEIRKTLAAYAEDRQPGEGE